MWRSAASSPVPCTNVAGLDVAIDVSQDVYINSSRVVRLDTTVPTSLSAGAPPGGFGIASGQPPHNVSEMVSGSATVFANGEPLIRHRDPTSQSAANCDGAVKLANGFSTGNGIEIDSSLTEAEQQQIIDALDLLYERPRSRELIETMQDTANNQGHTTTLTLTPDGNAAGGYSDGSARFMVDPPAGSSDPPTPGVGTSLTVWFNPTRTFAGTAMERPPEVGWAHELVHAYQAMAGIMIDGTRQNPGHSRPTNIRELQAVGLEEFAGDPFTDNAFREERGLPTRNSHDNTNTFDYIPTNVPAIAWATGTGGESLVYSG